MPIQNNRSEFILFLVVIFIFINITGCLKNDDFPENYGDILQAAAYIDTEPDMTAGGESKPEPRTETVSGAISFVQAETSASYNDITESISINGITEITEIIEPSESTEPLKPPEASEASEASELYVITPSGKKYHYETCRTVNVIKQHLTKEEAEQLKYEPCKICAPK